MKTITMNTEKLFSYGTLRYEEVQISTFGRKLEGQNDTLRGYKISQLQITNPDVIAKSGESVHPVLLATGNINDEVHGMVFVISKDELAAADKYEALDYKRIEVRLLSGINAWVYVGIN